MLMVPFASEMSPSFRFHVDGWFDRLNLKVQLLRLSWSRSTSIEGFTRLMFGTTMSRESSGSTATWGSISSSVAKNF